MRSDMIRHGILVVVLAAVCGSSAASGAGLQDLQPLCRGAVPNRVIVLLRRGGAYGAILFSRQAGGPGSARSVKYEWVWRADGKGALDPRDPDVASGGGEAELPAESFDAAAIVFGPFELYWNAAGEGYGALECGLPSFVLSVTPPLLCCVTTEDSFNDLNASDPEWRYDPPPLASGDSIPKVAVDFYAKKLLMLVPLVAILIAAVITFRRAGGHSGRLQFAGALVAGVLVLVDWALWDPYFGLLRAAAEWRNEWWAAVISTGLWVGGYCVAIGQLGVALRMKRMAAGAEARSSGDQQSDIPAI